VCCGTALFASGAKFDAACGWQSSFEPLDPANVREERDTSHGIERTEIICNICDAHLSHVSFIRNLDVAHYTALTFSVPVSSSTRMAVTC
jgi:peptide methionine sulfoxide reductase MsrB